MTALELLAKKEHPEIATEDWTVAYELVDGERTGRFQLLCERGEGDVFFPGRWLEDAAA